MASTPNQQQPASRRRLTWARQSSDGVLAALQHNALSIISSALPQRGYPALFNRYGAGAHFDAHAASAGAGIRAPRTRRQSSAQAATGTRCANGSVLELFAQTLQRLQLRYGLRQLRLCLGQFQHVGAVAQHVLCFLLGLERGRFVDVGGA